MNHKLFAKIFFVNIHRYIENIFGICTDCSLFTKFSHVQYYFNTIINVTIYHVMINTDIKTTIYKITQSQQLATVQDNVKVSY